MQFLKDCAPFRAARPCAAPFRAARGVPRSVLRSLLPCGARARGAPLCFVWAFPPSPSPRRRSAGSLLPLSLSPLPPPFVVACSGVSAACVVGRALGLRAYFAFVGALFGLCPLPCGRRLPAAAENQVFRPLRRATRAPPLTRTRREPCRGERSKPAPSGTARVWAIIRPRGILCQ